MLARKLGFSERGPGIDEAQQCSACESAYTQSSQLWNERMMLVIKNTNELLNFLLVLFWYLF